MFNDADEDRPGTAGGVVRFLVAAAVVAALVLVAVDNRRDVRLGYVVGDANAPVWVALVAAAIAGVIVAWLLRHRPRHH